VGGLVGVLASLTGIAAFVIQVYDRQQQPPPQQPQLLLQAPLIEPADGKGEEPPAAPDAQTKPQVKPPPERPAEPTGPTFTNSIGMKFVLIPAGTFTMGSPPQDIERCIKLKLGGTPAGDFKGEGPEHEVTITQPFYLGATKVTVGQFRAFVSATGAATDDAWQRPEWAQTDDYPVVNVSWFTAVNFCGWLSRKEGQHYRLPTEAEWEYACRAGKAGARYCYGDDEADLTQYAWTKANSGGKPHPVGRLKPNAWGLFDVHGNTWEWCQDRYDERYYKNSPRQDPAGPNGGGERVLRGGACAEPPVHCRAARRAHREPSRSHLNWSFRVVLVPPSAGGARP
jgi:formylglycine-generating enzyme required for sulfatase activity